MTTRRMVSKDWINDKTTKNRKKKDKRTFGYAGVRDPKQEGLQEEAAARSINLGGGCQGSVVGDINQEVMGEYGEIKYSPKPQDEENTAGGMIY